MSGSEACAVIGEWAARASVGNRCLRDQRALEGLVPARRSPGPGHLARPEPRAVMIGHCDGEVDSPGFAGSPVLDLLAGLREYSMLSGWAGLGLCPVRRSR